MLLKDPPLVYVATSDRVSGDVSFGSGAVMINSDQFIRNIVKTDEEARARSLCALCPARRLASQHTDAAMNQAKELIRRNRTSGNGKDGRRVLARLDSGTSNSLLALRSRLNEEAKRRTI